MRLTGAAASVMKYLPHRGNLVYLGFGVLIAAGLAVRAQTATSNCDITAAADAALKAQTQLINAGTVNPGKYFAPGGADSCISGDILQSFDLSNLIPDFSSLISSAIDSAINSLVNSMSSTVCNAANNALNGSIGNLNNAITNINTMFANDPNFANMIVGFAPITTSGNLSGTGTYAATGSTGNAFGIPVTGAGGAANGSGNNNSGNVGNSFQQCTQAAAAAVQAASAAVGAQINMASAWNAYTASGSGGWMGWGTSSYNPALYSAYVGAVTAYNQAVTTEQTAAAQINCGQGQSTYVGSGLGLVTPNASI